MYEKEQKPEIIAVIPQRVGDVAMMGAVARVDQEQRVDMGTDESVIHLIDHRKPPATKVPNLIVPLGPEMQAWLSEQRQKEADWHRRVAAWRYDHPY